MFNNYDNGEHKQKGMSLLGREGNTDIEVSVLWISAACYSSMCNGNIMFRSFLGAAGKWCFGGRKKWSAFGSVLGCLYHVLFFFTAFVDFVLSCGLSRNCITHRVQITDYKRRSSKRTYTLGGGFVVALRSFLWLHRRRVQNIGWGKQKTERKKKWSHWS